MDTYFTAVLYLLTALLGLCTGSFLNVVIYRLPNNMSLAKPASHCTKCGYELKWRDNIPLISYMFLGGKCRKCKARISLRYPLVEAINAFLWILSLRVFFDWTLKGAIMSLAVAIASSLLICIFFIDLDHMLIFNRFSIGLALCGIVLAPIDNSVMWYDRLIGGTAGAVSFLAIYYCALVILKKEGLGLGDVKLAAAAGLFLGWQRFILAILIASLLGSIIMLSLGAVRKERAGTEFPFGPFMVIGIAIAAFFGTQIISLYLGLILF